MIGWKIWKKKRYMISHLEYKSKLEQVLSEPDISVLFPKVILDILLRSRVPFYPDQEGCREYYGEVLGGFGDRI